MNIFLRKNVPDSNKSATTHAANFMQQCKLIFLREQPDDFFSVGNPAKTISLHHIVGGDLIDCYMIGSNLVGHKVRCLPLVHLLCVPSSCHPPMIAWCENNVTISARWRIRIRDTAIAREKIFWSSSAELQQVKLQI